MTHGVGVALLLHKGGELNEAQLVRGDGAAIPRRRRRRLEADLARRHGRRGLAAIRRRKRLHAGKSTEVLTCGVRRGGSGSRTPREVDKAGWHDKTGWNDNILDCFFGCLFGFIRHANNLVSSICRIRALTF